MLEIHIAQNNHGQLFYELIHFVFIHAFYMRILLLYRGFDTYYLVEFQFIVTETSEPLHGISFPSYM